MRTHTLPGRGWDRWRPARLSRSSTSSLLPKSQRLRVCPNSSIPPSQLPSDLRREKDKKERERAAGGSGRSGVASPARWGHLMSSGSQKWNNSGPSLAGATQSLPLPPSSSATPSSARRRVERSSRDLEEPDGPGRWDRVQLEGARHKPCRGQVIHCHPRSLLRSPAPFPGWPSSRGRWKKTPLLTWLGPLTTRIPTVLLFPCRQICPPQTVAGRQRTGEWWRDPRCHPLSRSARHAIPGSGRRQSPRHKGGDRSHGPRSGEPPNSRRCALTPSRRPQLLPGPAGCATPPAASPGKRGRRALFLPGFLRLGSSSSSSSAGVSGRCGSGAGLAGRGLRQHHHVAARRRPRRPGSRGSGKGGANHSPPLPPRGALNSASQVTRPGSPVPTCGSCPGPGGGLRWWPALSFAWIVGPFPAEMFHAIT